jgi:RND family efflux transporter MFP subunit
MIQEQQMNSMRSFLTPVLTMAVVACSKGSAGSGSSATAPVAVRIAPVAIEAIARPVLATGTVGPKEEVTLSFKVGGIIGRVLVDEGRVARAGDTLAVLDLSEIDAGVTRARSAAEKAERDLARAQRLYADSVATLEQTQDAQTGRDVAAAELTTALFNRRYAVILAPTAGVILRRTVEPGELVNSGTPILTMGSRSRGNVVRVALADRDAVRVALGDQAEVRFDALPDTPFAGWVSQIGAAADPMTGTYRVEVAVRGAQSLASGLVGQVAIRPKPSRPLPLVPVEALLEADGAQAAVFALSPDGRHAERRIVTIDFRSGDRVAIAAGLQNVRAVITDGAAYLDDGAAVTILP